MTIPNIPPSSDQRRSSPGLGPLLAVLGYLLGSVLVLSGLIASGSLLFLGLDIIAVVILGTNARGLRTRFLPRARQTLAAWGILGIVGLMSFAAFGSAAPSSPATTALRATSSPPNAAAVPTAARPETVVPTVMPTALPTPNAAAWLASVDADWQKSDWPATLAGLDALQAVDPDAIDFSDKRYAAQFSWGKTLLDNGDKIGAASHFAQASQIDTNRDELLALTPTPVPVPPTATPIAMRAAPTTSAPTHQLTRADLADIRSVLLASIAHYEEQLRSGKSALPRKPYPNSLAVTAAISDPASAARRFSNWTRSLPGADLSYLDAWQKADDHYTADNEPRALEDWRRAVDDADSATRTWADVALDWESGDVSNTQLALVEQRVHNALNRARASVDVIAPAK